MPKTQISTASQHTLTLYKQKCDNIVTFKACCFMTHFELAFLVALKLSNSSRDTSSRS